MDRLRIGSVIFKSVENEMTFNIGKMLSIIEEAAGLGVDIICFPELNMTGYSTTLDLRQSSLTTTHLVFDYLKKTARKNNITILAGFAEADENGGRRDSARVYAAHAVIANTGHMDVYRKLHLAPPEQSVLKKGNHIPVFHHDKVTFGIQLCYDAHFPRLTEAMAFKGIELLFIPHASPRGTPEEKFQSWMRHLPARAFDNAIFVVACNQVGTNQSGLTFPGIALAIDPSGRLINKAFCNADKLVISDLDPDSITQVRGHRMRYFLPNARTDIYES